jgi:hypothetical protein
MLPKHTNHKEMSFDDKKKKEEDFDKNELKSENHGFTLQIQL